MTPARRGGLLVTWLAAAMSLLTACRCAHAQRLADLPAGGPDEKNASPPPLVLSASVASLDAVSALVRDAAAAGADLPFLSPDFIEQRMPFIGPGGLARNRPLGVLFYVGKEFDLERSLTFVLPVNPGKAEIKTFTDKGAQAVAGRTDLVTLEGVSFRRTTDQFIFGQIPSAVAAVREDVLTCTYPGPAGVLARVDFDVAAMKKYLPERCEAFFTDVANANNPPARAGADFIARLMREVTRVGLSISRIADDGVRLDVRVEPFAAPKDFPATARLRLPGFPAGTTIARADLAYPPARALSRVTDALRALIAADDGFTKLAPSQQEQVNAAASSFAALLLAGDAGSLGVEAVNGQFVAHWITHRAAAAIDLERDMKALVQQAAGVAKSAKAAKPLAMYESYAASDGAKVHRLVLLNDGKREIYLDAIARDATVFMSIAQTDGKFVERLLPLPSPGTASSLLGGWIDLDALTVSGVIPAEIKLAKGQRLDWSAIPDGAALRIGIDVPKPLLQSLMKLLQQ
jgi:hypothetical protein